MEQEHSGRPITGRKVFFVVAGAFSVIIGVNLFLAFSAVSTFPGLEAKNSYVASQEFQAKREAQEALGWNVDLALYGSELMLTITDETGVRVRPEIVSATLGRATHVKADRTPEFVWRAGSYIAPAELDPGYWNLRLEAEAADGTPFRQRVQLYVAG